MCGLIVLDKYFFLHIQNPMSPTCNRLLATHAHTRTKHSTRPYYPQPMQVGNLYDCRKFQTGFDALFGPGAHVQQLFPTKYTPREAFKEYCVQHLPC